VCHPFDRLGRENSANQCINLKSALSDSLLLYNRMDLLLLVSHDWSFLFARVYFENHVYFDKEGVYD